MNNNENETIDDVIVIQNPVPTVVAVLQLTIQPTTPPSNVSLPRISRRRKDPGPFVTFQGVFVPGREQNLFLSEKNDPCPGNSSQERPT